MAPQALQWRRRRAVEGQLRGEEGAMAGAGRCGTVGGGGPGSVHVCGGETPSTCGPPWRETRLHRPVRPRPRPGP